MDSTTDASTSSGSTRLTGFQLVLSDLLHDSHSHVPASPLFLQNHGDMASDSSSDSSSPSLISPLTVWASADIGSDDFKACQHPECTDVAQSQDLCFLHSGECRDNIQDSSQDAASGGFCVPHVDERNCTSSGCTNSAVNRGRDLCVQHGGWRICKHEGCSKHVASGGLCRAHGGGKRCKVPGCMSGAQSRGVCYVHGGGGRCQEPGCESSAKKGGSCIAHGGGHRCQVHGCTSSAVSGDLCRAHGGGKRCAIADCKSSAKTGGFCIAHGGGKRCAVESCKSSAQRLGLCKAHGGGRKCVTPGCANCAVSRGKCIAHGGGKRCIQDGCSTTARRGGYCFAHGGRAPTKNESDNKLVGDTASCSKRASKYAQSQFTFMDMLAQKEGPASVSQMIMTPKPAPSSAFGLSMTPPQSSQPLRIRLPSMNHLLSKQDSAREAEHIPPIRSAIPLRYYNKESDSDRK